MIIHITNAKDAPEKADIGTLEKPGQDGVDDGSSFDESTYTSSKSGVLVVYVVDNILLVQHGTQMIQTMSTQNTKSTARGTRFIKRMMET